VVAQGDVDDLWAPFSVSHNRTRIPAKARDEADRGGQDQHQCGRHAPARHRDVRQTDRRHSAVVVSAGSGAEHGRSGPGWPACTRKYRHH